MHSILSKYASKSHHPTHYRTNIKTHALLANHIHIDYIIV